jgi:tetratricopeptide (TPR) repeat protein
VLCKALLARTSGPSLDDVVEPFHERVRDGLLRTMSAEAKALAHERIALSLEAAGRNEHQEMALHWARAGAGARAAEQWLLAAKALMRAGESAQARHALQRAADCGDESTAGEARAVMAEMLVEDGDVRAALALAQSAGTGHTR